MVRVSPRLRAGALVIALIAVASLPIVALWHAFAPHSHGAPDFTLVDQDGKAFTLSAQRGHPVVLFFGYTHCPDACPTTLAHLARAVRLHEAPPDVRVAFVTVDPARDSPAVLRRYLALFDPRFIGLTGRKAVLEPIYDAYDTWYDVGPTQHGSGDYSVAHGATIYFIGRDGVLNGRGDWKDDTRALVRDMEKFR